MIPLMWSNIFDLQTAGQKVAMLVFDQLSLEMQ